MTRDFRFYKTAKGDWYIDLPEWKGDPEDLQMIQGADEWLDLVSSSNEVLLNVADVDFENAEFITLIRLGEPNLGGGGNYYLERYQEQRADLKIWLCEIVTFIFDKYPQRIYFKVK
ncbi:DUF6717 family protein [Pedobacter xixiisoli]|uniref:Uncharacterized protein n=1 Tax=Pedobacter xixiisoli TaxID=1476464 RepID=A0A285ZZU0_9SPHI|nr:DUF6717 family protein [Pedobacter xixiisoli]SOD15173.1 hypothetical protein SAMN06297358_2149 [Pedobacter xixiisoli]